MQARAITALVTPFGVGGAIDFEALDRLIDFQIDGGTEGLVLCGSTGEGSLLTQEEKLSIFHRAIEKAKGEIELIANIGGCCTHESVELAHEAHRLGVDALIAIVPYYVKPTREGCLRHFAAIAAVGLPLIVYHHPGRTGTSLPLEALLEITAIPGVVGIKEASGNLDLAAALVQDGITLYSGDDFLCTSHLALGGWGSISVCGNLIPNRWKEVVHLKKISAEIEQLCNALMLEVNPQCVKFGASLLGLCSPQMRLPLIEPSEENQRKIREVLQIAGLALR